MRTVLRTSIVTAALAGAMLAPAAGAAFAAPAPQAVTSTTKAAAPQVKKVAINKHLIANMSNSPTSGPSVQIHITNEDGTVRPKALATLDRKHTKQAAQGTVFTLTEAETAEPVLTVFEGGVTTSFPLPKGTAANPAPSPAPAPARYAGQAVYIGNGMVAVLRNKSEGPEAWIRYVGAQWKPGDSYMSRVLAVLDRRQTTDSAYGASFKLTKAETAAPVLVVTINGASKSYALPRGKAGQNCSAESKIQDIGAGTTAELYMSPEGPKVALRTAGEATAWRILDRGFPALNKSDGIVARIVNPSGAKPVFEWRTQGGATPLGRTTFPALPQGCKLNYKVTEQESGSKPGSTTPAGTKPQTQAQTPVQTQTAVVPKGAVAAGAELPVETVADTDNGTTLAAGAGLFAIAAALGGAALRRRRVNG
ncbi:hypothetical protein [Streptomyces sp. NBC_01565]|uniref:hypothetical protein n=1 Tax=Streptomyces sp. NBC_01565 TaxID=2975881 RepID=UPI0022550904|nr:hypothetical protein [Streptomyces sp. NBC_01565]MCX4541701.1 hypothetical protein [Streptomyces sp. NBC_01565]